MKININIRKDKGVTEFNLLPEKGEKYSAEGCFLPSTGCTGDIWQCTETPVVSQPGWGCSWHRVAETRTQHPMRAGQPPPQDPEPRAHGAKAEKPGLSQTLPP